MMYGNHWMFGGWMWFFWLLVIIGIVLLVVWLVQRSRPAGPKKDDSALELLKQRYARGEINREEFEQKKRDLLS
jgi:putative membrane protein